MSEQTTQGGAQLPEAVRELTETFGPVIYAYTREQAIEDGLMVDVTEWASRREMRGGYFPADFNQTLWKQDDTPVVFSRKLWEEVNMDKDCPGEYCDKGKTTLHPEGGDCPVCRGKGTVKRIAGALEDTRGRAHDVIWMSSLAAKGACGRAKPGDTRVVFHFNLILTKDGSSIMRGRPVTLKGVIDGDGVWLGYPDED